MTADSTKNSTDMRNMTEAEWEKYQEAQTDRWNYRWKYPNGEPLRFRCPYCGDEFDPFPGGCCGEIHYEPIPPYELENYDG